MGSYYEFLRFPACGFFLLSFVFQMRLIQEVFKVHYQNIIMDQAVIKKKMLSLYLGIYICFIVFFIYQDIFLYHPGVLMISNGSLWIPQIYHVYKKNIKNHLPSMKFFFCLTASQTYLILYLFGCQNNFF
jgi:hypothetical protein